MQVLGVDIGGSGIKGALVDIESGELATERLRITTPRTFEIEAVTKTVARLVRKFDYRGPVGIGFPAAVSRGVVLTPPTAHEVSGWIGESLNNRFSTATGCNVTVLNDADAAGLAEMRYGAGKGLDGVVITVTLGTGVGGGLFMDGRLVPNLEIGKIYLKGQQEVAELFVASRIKTEKKLTWKQYGRRLQEFFLLVEHVFSPQMIIIGGGVSGKHAKFLPDFPLTRTPVVPAELLNQAGIVGAAVWAADAMTVKP